MTILKAVSYTDKYYKFSKNAKKCYTRNPNFHVILVAFERTASISVSLTQMDRLGSVKDFRVDKCVHLLHAKDGMLGMLIKTLQLFQLPCFSFQFLFQFMLFNYKKKVSEGC